MATFSEALLHLRQDLDQSREDRKKLICRIRAEVQEMARQTGSRLAEQGQARRAEFAAMMQDMRGTIRQQADRTRGQLAELAGDLHHGGDVFAGRARGTRSSRSR
jgi:uncharacterized protein YukE